MLKEPLIERLESQVSDADFRALAALLSDAVESGAAVSFLAPLPLDRAEAWWRATFAGFSARSIVLAARDDEGICGTVQVLPAWAPNQPHRGEIVKLLVHRRCRRAGVGKRLMLAAEDLAKQGGLLLLTLDAKAGTAAEQLYRQLGWTETGRVPGYALDSDGTPHDAVFFYKVLDGSRESDDARSPGGLG